MDNRIQNGEIEKILITSLDENGDFITALSDVYIEITRLSDGYYLDFDDNTFKNSGWVSKTQLMVELDSSNSPGVYFYNFNTSGFDDDDYYIRVISVTSANSPWEGVLRVGGFIDNLDVKISTRAILNEYDDRFIRLLGLNQENYRIFDPVYNDSNSLLSATIKIYSSASDCENDINVISSYALTATYDGDNNMSTYKVVKS